MKSFRASLKPHAKIFLSCFVDQKPLSIANLSQSLSHPTLQTSKNFINRNDGTDILRVIFEIIIAALINTPASGHLTICGFMFRLPPADVSEQLVPFSFNWSRKSKLSIWVRERVKLAIDGESFSESISPYGWWVPPESYDKYWRGIYKCRVIESCGTLSSDRTGSVSCDKAQYLSVVYTQNLQFITLSRYTKFAVTASGTVYTATPHLTLLS